ncbi:MAG: hypothetical protein C4547_07060 [Phycisphaerales bacterium]|nr:MAG: hypothetical protein C4547_07060 [Phycisphaerales bacterium]
MTADPATGITRHADAGYEQALRVARDKGVTIPTYQAGGLLKRL